MQMKEFSLNYMSKFYFFLRPQNDNRQYIPLSSFGFYEKGHLIVKITEFALQLGRTNLVVSCYRFFSLFIDVELTFKITFTT